MASYAMAHFKLDMKLKETGYAFKDDSRLRVYLTNSLEEPPKEVPELFMEKWLAEEANEANGIKNNTPVMVVLGNPPYSGESANITADDFLAPYKKEPGGVDKLKERNSKWLNDDYVKFIRYGQNFIEKYGEGVLAYINNHSFLDNPTFRGMRWNLLDNFEKIYILDLHGNSKKKETAPDGSKDENVFDITVGVSINLFIKTGKKKDGEPAKVFHYDMYGRRQAKYTYLQENTLSTIKWQELSPLPNQYLLVKKHFVNEDEYKSWFSPVDLFNVNVMGFQTHRDFFAIDFDKSLIIDRAEDFRNGKISDEEIKVKYALSDNRDWKLTTARIFIKKDTHWQDKIIECEYRPFDRRYCYFSYVTMDYPRKELLQNVLNKDNYLLGIGRQGAAVGSMDWCLAYVSKNPVDANIYRRGGINLFPLYIYPDDDSLDKDEKRRPNLSPPIVQEISAKTGLIFTEEKDDRENTFAPIDLLDYIYAVLYSNNYRTKYREFLKIDFPRIPYPENAKQFQKLASIGSLLRNLHLMENVSPVTSMADFPVAGTNEIEAVNYKAEKVYVNKHQYFENISPEIWGYYIGGYQPAEKWLKDRKGRVLSFEDIEHYQKIITVLKMTIELQAQIDEVIT
jgi:predicted helicase